MPEAIDIVENSKDRNVLAICGAGAHRSVYIAEVLNGRGWSAKNRGVRNNFVEAGDLESVGTIIFASPEIRGLFEDDEKLMEIVRTNGIELKNINVTQADDDKASREKTVNQLKEKISAQLTKLGFEEYKKTVTTSLFDR